MRATLRAALLAFLASASLAAAAQTCTVCGVVSAIREVNAGPAAGAQRREPAAVGSPSALDTGPVVGTVARFEFDRKLPANDTAWRLGGAGTPEMERALGRADYRT